MGATDHVLPYFTAFRNPTSPLYDKAFNQTFPNDFVADVQSGNLPSVSWLIPPLGFDEHPSASSMNGMYFTSLVLDALTSNPKVWSKTAFFLMYDENDGWFDHVPPPTAPPGTEGEYLTAKPAAAASRTRRRSGIAGPLGLGVRVPMLVISPFSRGGHIASEVFDHTSQLQLVSKRFGVEVPNVSAWRRRTVGDLTSTMFHGKKDTPVPELPATRCCYPPAAPARRSVRRPRPGARGRASRPSSACPSRVAAASRPATSSRPPRRERAISDDDRTVIAPEGPRR